jgi:hypothetical protein
MTLDAIWRARDIPRIKRLTMRAVRNEQTFNLCGGCKDDWLIQKIRHQLFPGDLFMMPFER